MAGLKNVPLTVQARIVAEVVNRINAMLDVDQVNGTDPTANFWNVSATGPMYGSSALEFPKYSLEQGPETTSDIMFPMEDKVLTLYVEWAFAPLLDVDNFTTFRYYLGRLQQVLFGTIDHRQLGGLSINVVETNNQPQIESATDPSPGGLLTFQVHYRVVQGDPYHMPSEIQSYG
jgi:hypothetical protein